MRLTMDIKKQLDFFSLDVALEAQSGWLGILGESGAGKSMLLKILAGLEKPDEGHIGIQRDSTSEERVLFDSSEKISVRAQKRRIGYLFQSYALFPNMTVMQNILCATGGMPDARERAKEILQKFGLMPFERRYPDYLSGGQQQRVALARILVYQPDIILLDEPFSALDESLRDSMQLNVKEMLKDYQGIVILVSHSRDEIYSLCDEMIVLDQGEIVRRGSTQEVFQNPYNVATAKLIGCENIVRANRFFKTYYIVEDWKVYLEMTKDLFQDEEKRVLYVGIRAQDLKPVWGEEDHDIIPFQVRNIVHLPFEDKYFIKAENPSVKDICWSARQDAIKEIEEKGLPTGLKIEAEKILWLKRW